MNYKKIILKPLKEESLNRFHPWVFSGAIRSKDEQLKEGDIAAVYTSNGDFIALGHYQVDSITVRVLSFQEVEIDYAFWLKRLEVALAVRKSLGLIDNPTTNAFRLVHGEGDNLPGLIIDVYGTTAVMQAHSVGMHCDRLVIAEALSELVGARIENIYYKS
ncbi:MAG: class I SAM-dependent rRNA methyltransferase, partial [Bacteroidaceae bacterium]